MSEYLDRLTRVIQKEHGTVDKYIGDAIMAFWGAPEKLEDISGHACRAALRCQEELARLNDGWHMAGKPEMPTGIGIHVGDTILGNVGSRERMNTPFSEITSISLQGWKGSIDIMEHA